MTRPRRSVAPTGDVPFLPDRSLEDEANLLLAEYGEKFAPVTAAPVPIDDIIELHLQLRFEMRDLQEEFGARDVHGAIWFKQEKIAVDQILDPDSNPRMLGRYRYTLGHETGHWRLHRAHYMSTEGQLALFDKKNEKPAYVCRSSRKPRVEIQADRFSAFLLMPRNLVVAAWEKWRGGMAPIVLEDLRAKQRQILTAEVLRRGGFKSGDNAIDDMLLEHAARPLADAFQVSSEAMRIRLETLKLLLRKRERTLF